MRRYRAICKDKSMELLQPFVPKLEFSTEQHQILVLAAVFQAAQLVHMVATSGSNRIGEMGEHYREVSIKAALNIRPDGNPNSNSQIFFPHLSDVELGLRTLEQCFSSPYQSLAGHSRLPRLRLKNPKLTLQYALALLNLSAKVYRNVEHRKNIRQTQQNIIRQLAFFGHHYHHHSIIAPLAQLYSETASTLKPKIMVQGNAESFKNPNEVAMIRALLFSGLQAAHYWRNLGGTPWKLLFSKGKMIKQLRYFAKLQHQQPKVAELET
jgi:high frequency lysogenization protein